MSIITTIFGTLLYLAVGLIASSVTVDHINDLCEKVEAYNPSYRNRLWFHVTLKRTKVKEFMVDVVFMVFWPAICIAAILKAEWEYDTIVHHSAFERKASR